MVETARAAKPAPLRRDAVLEAVAFAAERLLLSSDWSEVAVEVLGRLGVAADVSRVHLVRNEDTGGGLIMQIAAEWCSPGTHSTSRRSRSWTVSSGSPTTPGGLNGCAPVSRSSARSRTFPEQERPALRHQSIVSRRVLPDHRGRRLVGLHRLLMTAMVFAIGR